MKMTRYKAYAVFLICTGHMDDKKKFISVYINSVCVYDDKHVFMRATKHVTEKKESV